jgi:hypothetical protein
MAKFQRAITPMGQKLQAIQRLRLTDGLAFDDAKDILMWCALAGNNFEMAQFSDKTLERIESIFNQYFKED